LKNLFQGILNSEKLTYDFNYEWLNNSNGKMLNDNNEQDEKV